MGVRRTVGAREKYDRAEHHRRHRLDQEQPLPTLQVITQPALGPPALALAQNFDGAGVTISLNEPICRGTAQASQATSSTALTVSRSG